MDRRTERVERRPDRAIDTNPCGQRVAVEFDESRARRGCDLVTEAAQLRPVGRDGQLPALDEIDVEFVRLDRGHHVPVRGDDRFLHRLSRSRPA